MPEQLTFVFLNELTAYVIQFYFKFPHYTNKPLRTHTYIEFWELYMLCICMCMYDMLFLFYLLDMLCPAHTNTFDLTYVHTYLMPTQVHKVQHLQHISSLSSLERRNAEMALFCKQPQQAEAIYLQSNLIFRAIEVNINLYNWERCVVGGGGGGGIVHMYVCMWRGMVAGMYL